MQWSKTLHVVCAHAAGEVGKVITGGVLDVPGKTMLEKMRHLNQVDDSLRRFTVQEPRGSSQITVNLLLPPTRPDADAAFVPMQADSCHGMSGSNAMCVTTVLLETGILPMQEPETTVVLDTPSGLVTATADCFNGKCVKVSLDFMPAFALHLDHVLMVPGLGTIRVDIAFGGDFFVLIDAQALDLEILPEKARELVDIGTKIYHAAVEQVPVQHPMIPELNRIGYAMFCDSVNGRPLELRSGTVMLPGRMDRSPCGTGSAARLAVLHARESLEIGKKIRHRSIIDSVFDLEITGVTRVGDYPAVLPRISGSAWIYAVCQYGVDPSDPYPLGYMLSDTWGPGVEKQMKPVQIL